MGDRTHITPKHIALEVEQIRSMAKEDRAAAHEAEDDLFVRVLRAIASGHTDAQDIASAALMSRLIRFARNCT